MKLVIEILFMIITVLLMLGTLGEKTDKWKSNYFFGTIVMAIITILANKFL